MDNDCDGKLEAQADMMNVKNGIRIYFVSVIKFLSTHWTALHKESLHINTKFDNHPNMSLIQINFIF